MPSTTTPNMSLVLPTIGQEQAPTWASDLNNSLSIVDGHDHASGSGVQITPAGLNINVDLPFGGNNATGLRSLRLSVQSAKLNGASDLSCLYAYDSSGDLYFNDGLGNQIQMTASGAIAGTPGNISGLTAPASASYTAVSDKFIWQQAANTSADMDFGSAIMRNDTANSKALTLSPPAAMAADYTITLPAVGSTAHALMQIDTAGAITSLGLGSAAYGLRVNSAGTAIGWVGPNVVTSSSSSNFSTSNTSATAVTNLSVSITTTGRPVMLLLIADGSGNGGVGPTTSRSTGYMQQNVQFYRGASALNIMPIGREIDSTSSELLIPCGSCSFVETPTAGTYTYSVYTYVNNGSDTAQVFYCKLVAIEL